MTPEELKEITTLFEGLSPVDVPDGSNGWIYLISSLSTFVLIARWFKKAFVKAMVVAMEDAIALLVTKLIESHADDVEELKLDHKELKKKVHDNHETILSKLKRNCAPPDIAEG